MAANNRCLFFPTVGKYFSTLCEWKQRSWRWGIMLPLKIYTRRKIFNYYTGFSFFIFIWISRLTQDEVKLVRHEKIHFLQQVEMLFIFHWLFYGSFYLVSRWKGQGHHMAYRHNPFELEAYDNEPDVSYLQTRKPFAWLKYVRKWKEMFVIDGTNQASRPQPTTKTP